MMELSFGEQRVNYPLKAKSGVKVALRLMNHPDKHKLFRDGSTAYLNTTSRLEQQFSLYAISPTAQSSSIFACGPAVSTSGILSRVTEPRCLIHSVSTRK